MLRIKEMWCGRRSYPSQSEAARLLVLLLAAGCGMISKAACPFASVAHGSRPLGDELDHWVGPSGGGAATGRKLAQAPAELPPLCNVSAVLAEAPYNPPGPDSQGEVDRLVKQVSWQVITQPLSGIGTVRTPNHRLPIAAFARLAFHDAGTFVRANKTGGANGSVRLEEPSGANRMQLAIDLVAAWRTQINALLAWDTRVPWGVKISHADVMQLAGAAAVTVSGGPSKAALYDRIPVGRIDDPPADAPPGTPSPDNFQLLPLSGFGIRRLICTFVGNGYTLEELAALSGVHTIGFKQGQRAMGGAAVDAATGNKSGIPIFDLRPPKPQPLNPSPLVFDGNSYYRQVLNSSAAFHSDNALTNNPTTLKWVRRFAADKAAFHQAFAKSFIKMGKMGAKWQTYGAQLMPF